MINYTNDRSLAYRCARQEAKKCGVMLETFDTFAIRTLADENKREFGEVLFFMDFHICPHPSKIAMIKRLSGEGKQVYVHTEDLAEIENNTGANRIKDKANE